MSVEEMHAVSAKNDEREERIRGRVRFKQSIDTCSIDSRRGKRQGGEMQCTDIKKKRKRKKEKGKTREERDCAFRSRNYQDPRPRLGKYYQRRLFRTQY